MLQPINLTNDVSNGPKILLISVNNLWRYSNVGVDQIAGYLRLKGYNVDILYHHKNVDFAEVKIKLDLDYHVYGFSVNSSNYQCCLRLMKYLKSHNSNAITVLGGGFPTRYYKEILDNSLFVDYIILGDGEIPFENLLNNLYFSNELSLNQHIVTHKDTVNKSAYCNFAIDYFPVFDYYFSDIARRNARKEYCIQTKNNICTGKCSFCTERKGTVTYKSVSHIVSEINYVFNTFGVKKYFFTDDNIFDPNTDYAKSKVELLCTELKKLNMNIVFKCYIKSISLTDTESDNKLLELMSEVGFKTMFVGIESGNESDLLLYNKNTTVADNYTILKLLKRHGIVAQIGFINLNPYSTLKTIRENYYFLAKIEMSNLFMYVFSYLRVYKYTDIYYKMHQDGLLMSQYDYLDDKSLYEMCDPEAMKIFKFVLDKMADRIRSMDFEFDWLYSFYLECKHLNPSAAVYESELQLIRENIVTSMNRFFYDLFVLNDIEKCNCEVDSFLTFFEKLQPQYLEIHRKLLVLYLS